MKFSSILKRTAMAAVTAASLTSVVTPANALLFNPDDAVLVIYGNSQEAYVNLGNWTSLKQNGTSLNLSSILATAGVGGASPIEYTIVGNGPTGTVPFWFGAQDAIGLWTTTNKNQIVPTNYDNALDLWRGQLTNANNAAQTIYAKADSLSFTSFLDASGTDRLGTSMSRRASSDIDVVLNLLERTGAASSLAQITTALLSSNGQFTVNGLNPVPVPAAAVLFASGLIGLAGMARRSMGLTR